MSSSFSWSCVRRRRAQLCGITLVLAVLSSTVLVACAESTTGIFYSNTPTSSDSQPAPAVVVNAVTHVSPAVITAVGTGGVTNGIAAVPPSAAGGPLVNDGKPSILWIGANYCPFCAAQRWSIIVALSRFGTFSNLRMTTSSSTDVYSNTPTFTFYGSSYTSTYLDFQAVEETARDPNTALQTPTLQQDTLLQTYDTQQYVGGTEAGGIPFVDFGNLYVVVSSGYSPQLLSGLSQIDVVAKLRNANDPVTQAIVGNANWLTAAICKITNNQPGAVCATGPIPQIEAQLAKER